MKRSFVFVLLIVAVMLSVFLSACSPANGAVQGFVQLPDDIRVGITALVLVAVSWVFARVITLIPYLKFLDEFREPLAMAIALELINLIQNAVPDAFGVIAILALKLILAVLALYMTFGKLRAQGVKAFK
jgi:hypothetical protein